MYYDIFALSRIYLHILNIRFPYMINKHSLKALSLIKNKSAFARKLNISRQNIYEWAKTGIPPRHVIALEKYINKQVTKEQILPDIYPKK